MREQQRYDLWQTVGWLGIAFGGLFGLASLGFIVLAFVLSARGIPPVVRGAQSLPPPMRFLYADARILPTIFLFGALLAVVAGIGLIRRRPFGRPATLVFGALSISWFLFGTTAQWLAFLRPAREASSLLFRLGPVIVITPVALLYCVGVGLLCRSVYAHPEAFRREPPEIGA